MSSDRDRASASRDVHDKVVLVVEDDEAIGEIIVDTISGETSYQARLATSGQKALQMLGDIKPILFVLDYQLPGMTGIQLYDYLQGIEAYKNIPSIIISANLPRAELQKRQLTGLQKPFDLDDLTSSIKQLLR